MGGTVAHMGGGGWPLMEGVPLIHNILENPGLLRQRSSGLTQYPVSLWGSEAGSIGGRELSSIDYQPLSGWVTYVSDSFIKSKNHAESELC